MQERELTPPCGSGVEIGKPYPYTLLTHCGIRGAYFAGRKWVPSPVLTAEKVHPPPGWGNPFHQGEMRLLAEDLARFVTGTGLAAEFRPLPEGDKYPWGPCA